MPLPPWVSRSSLRPPACVLCCFEGILWDALYNQQGQLGIGDTTFRFDLQKVGAIRSVAPGLDSGFVSSTIIIKADGTMWGAGFNGDYELGLGDTTNRLSFTQIGTDSDWAVVANNDSSALAIKIDGTLWGWGLNGNGELGNGTFTPVQVPTQIGTDDDWISVSMGGRDYFAGHAILMKLDRTIWGAGSNSDGQLGLGDYIDRTSFTQIGTDLDWAKLFAVRFRTANVAATFAIKTDGTLWATGHNSFGGLGIGNLLPTNVFTQEATLATDWKDVGTDNVGMSMGIKTDGTIWQWGNLTGFTTPTQYGTDSDWELLAQSCSAFGIKTNGTLWENPASGPMQLGTATYWVEAASSGSSVFAVQQ